MKIKYEFATETIEIEVSEDWANLLIDLDRLEYNNDHTAARHNYSLDSIEYEGTEFGVECEEITNFPEHEDLRNAIAQLPESQQVLLHAYFYEDLSYTEIAQKMGNTPQAVRQAVERAKKQIKKILTTPV